MKTTKRILAVLMAVMLVFALSVTVSATNTNTLTVTGDKLGGKKVTIVPMFIQDTTTNTYTLASGWAGFFTDKVTVTGADDPTLSEKAYDYMLNLGTDSAGKTSVEKMNEFAKLAKTHYKDHTSDFSTTAVTETADNTNTATFTNLEAGSYLVMPAGGSISATRDTDAIITNVVEGSTANTVAIKTEYPTVTKEVETENGTYADDTAAGVGDTVKFKLTSAVPDMSDYDRYVFNFVDTMSAGLTYLPDSVEVTIGTKTNAELSPSYTVSCPAQVLTVAFADLKSVAGINAGDVITVTYSAKINENAITGTSTNSALVQYSNDPTTDTLGESNPSTTTVYTYDIVIRKYTNDGGTERTLSGAVFQISKSATGTPAIPLVAVAGENDTYSVATEEEIANSNVTKVTQVTTPANGLVTIKGLDAATYYVKEVTPPTGYNGIDAPLTVVIEKDDTAPTHVNYTVAGADQGTDSTVNVLNNLGTVLPTTGSVGTIIFTVIGVGVIIAGVMFTSRKKKENE